MTYLYVRRYRMEIPLAVWSDAETAALEASLPFRLLPWKPELLEAHAEAKWRSFVGQMDSTVFACLGERDGCGRLMAEIVRRQGFVPEATWLAVEPQDATGEWRPVGTVQGIEDPRMTGLIQNLGVTPDRQGKRLGELLLRKAIDGFKRVGCRTASLEVTSANSSAVKLYRRVGFEVARTVYKTAIVNVPVSVRD
jgi:ribosomal protein S18 acetylase RimI-like enzyme